jgi:hypothetical protein
MVGMEWPSKCYRPTKPAAGEIFGFLAYSDEWPNIIWGPSRPAAGQRPPRGADFGFWGQFEAV